MAAINLGSRYKTPILPIWVTLIDNNWGVLFNPNRDLMKSYSAENRYLSWRTRSCESFDSLSKEYLARDLV